MASQRPISVQYLADGWVVPSLALTTIFSGLLGTTAIWTANIICVEVRRLPSIQGHYFLHQLLLFEGFNLGETMFPAVVHARRRNIRTPERRISDMKHRSPSDGILPHSLSPRKISPAADPSSDVATVGSWMLRTELLSRSHAQTANQEASNERNCDGEARHRASTSLPSSPNQLPRRQGHYGFNATAHTNDRAVALACVMPATSPNHVPNVLNPSPAFTRTRAGIV
jgi:hypothetical protein